MSRFDLWPRAVGRYMSTVSFFLAPFSSGEFHFPRYPHAKLCTHSIIRGIPMRPDVAQQFPRGSGPALTGLPGQAAPPQLRLPDSPICAFRSVSAAWRASGFDQQIRRRSSGKRMQARMAMLRAAAKKLSQLERRGGELDHFGGSGPNLVCATTHSPSLEASSSPSNHDFDPQLPYTPLGESFLPARRLSFRAMA
jgi:hypothetical protein